MSTTSMIEDEAFNVVSLLQGSNRDGRGPLISRHAADNRVFGLCLRC